ncbi:rhamnan synthesis F family protein [Tabrizicola sp. BL-A-41-H6]|uniref:rhamnan synthesis F family protein n=1 Tax=Tabrizicola sp. BL-A-41-H6 TaxID=3421107 RepID=UPI003D678226
MIPAWKLRREMRRLSHHISSLPKRIASVPSKLKERREVATYDRDFDRLVQITHGDQVAKTKYAIFLLYQPKAVPRSVFLTLEYLVDRGYAPLVVINGSVAPEHIPALRRRSWLLVQRGNIGYDFGGYRDGLRVLRERVDSLERLIVMNDSVWFPIGGDPVSTLEDRLDNQDLDAVGLNQDQKATSKPDGSAEFEDRQIESYFYLFSARLWASDTFRDFWQSYRMSSDKKYTIKHGEVGFSKQMMGAGHRFAGLMRRSDFLGQIDRCSADFLRKVLTYAAYADADYAQVRDDLLARYDESETWRQDALKHIRRYALRRPFNVSFCVASDRLVGTTYMKKNSQTYFHDMRVQYLRAVTDGAIASPDPIILEEIQALVASHDPRTAERTL